MSAFDLESFVEEFCSHAVYSQDGGKNKLNDLLSQNGMSLSSILLNLWSKKRYDLAIKFLEKVHRYITECHVNLGDDDSLEKFFMEMQGDETGVTTELKVAFFRILLDLNLSDWHRMTGIIPIAISNFSSETLQLSDYSSQVLHAVAGSDIALASDVVTKVMEKIYEVDASIHLRFLFFFAGLAKKSSEYFSLCESKGAVSAIISSCQKPDVLVQTVTLDLLEDISATTSGAVYLHENRILHWLAAMGGGVGGTDFLVHSQRVEESLKPQAIKCTASVLKNIELLAPRLLYSYIPSTLDSDRAAVYSQASVSESEILPIFVSGLLFLLENHGEIEKLTALNAIAIYATSSPRAYIMLLSSDRLLQSWLELLRSQPTVQASCLHTIAQVLLYPALLRDESIPTDQAPIRGIHKIVSLDALEADMLTGIMTELDAIKRKIFGMISIQFGSSRYSSSMEYLVKLAKGPIGELKHAAYDVLRALAYQCHSWGVHTLFEFTPFFPFLLDRSTEHSKEGKDWKFSLIVGLYYSPHVLLLTQAISQRIETLVAQGAYFTPSEMAEPATLEL